MPAYRFHSPKNMELETLAATIFGVANVLMIPAQAHDHSICIDRPPSPPELRVQVMAVSRPKEAQENDGTWDRNVLLLIGQKAWPANLWKGGM